MILWTLTAPLLAVALAGAWLASRPDGPRAPLGLAAVATLAAVVQLPRVLGSIVTGGQLAAMLTVALPGATLAAALLALNARGDRYPLGLPGLRRAVAAVVALWALASAGAPLARHMLTNTTSEVLPPELWLGHLLTPLVILAIAVAVWRCDSVTVVPAVLVITLSALWTVGSHAAALMMKLGPDPLRPPLVAGAELGVALPPGRGNLAISARAGSGSATVQRTQLARTVSKRASANGSRSRGPMFAAASWAMQASCSCHSARRGARRAQESWHGPLHSVATFVYQPPLRGRRMDLC